MIKLRLYGTPEEVEKAFEQVEKAFEILYKSEPYHDKGKSKFVRIYCDVETKK